ncbi:hypothetical protein RRG08_054477 [Elysia crispata]|uniref:Uncharacterized protein n=1 Tax=Elysia crispata TaxID=231223 RepID=A0AAE1CTV2_9GAST|nr:hypothetical protein RRG08_054477 [Elysia crispata]
MGGNSSPEVIVRDGNGWNGTEMEGWGETLMAKHQPQGADRCRPASNECSVPSWSGGTLLHREDTRVPAASLSVDIDDDDDLLMEAVEPRLVLRPGSLQVPTKDLKKL